MTVPVQTGVLTTMEVTLVAVEIGPSKLAIGSFKTSYNNIKIILVTA